MASPSNPATASIACRSACSCRPTAVSLPEDDNQAVNDTFALRRLRPYLRGRILRRFEFYLNPDFAGGTLVVQDAYLDTIFSPAFRIRAGKGKTPFGMERLHSASNLLFMDRALPTSLAPNRDLGVQVLGDVHGGVFSYLAGVMNGVADGGSADLDTNDGKDVSDAPDRPPVHAEPDEPVPRPRRRGVGFHAADRRAPPRCHRSGRRRSSSPTSRTPPGAVADGRRTRYSPQIFFFRGRSVAGPNTCTPKCR